MGTTIISIYRRQNSGTENVEIGQRSLTTKSGRAKTQAVWVPARHHYPVPLCCHLCPRLMASKPFHSPSCMANTQRCLLHQYTSSFHMAGKNSSPVEFSSSLQTWLQTSSPPWSLFGRFLFIHAHVELCHLERDFTCKMRWITVVPQKDGCED